MIIDLIREFLDNAVSRKQGVNRWFINDISDDVSEFIEKIKENKPDGAEFKLMMKYQDETIKMWIVKCLVRSFED